MKIGVIYCCYGNPEYINDCLNPWIEAKKTNDILVAAVHGQFKEYHDLGIEDSDEKTFLNLCNKESVGILDYLYAQNDYGVLGHVHPVKYQTEAEIRDKGLQYLLKQECDLIWLLDNDEFYTVEQINNILNYIQDGDNKFYSWYSIPFKNYIFSGKEWVAGFRPPRIFKRQSIRYDLVNCYWDNDFNYKGDNDKLFSYKELPHKDIPERIVNGGIKHMTWLHSNGKEKVNYQLKHFGHCSYKWNEEKQGLEFDLDFHKKNNLSLPIINRDE